MSVLPVDGRRQYFTVIFTVYESVTSVLSVKPKNDGALIFNRIICFSVRSLLQKLAQISVEYLTYENRQESSIILIIQGGTK